MVAFLVRCGLLLSRVPVAAGSQREVLVVAYKSVKLFLLVLSVECVVK